MTQSERLMQGIQFSRFRVDEGSLLILEKINNSKLRTLDNELKSWGLSNFNSTKEMKTWLEGMGIDCSRGVGKIVYEDPVNLAAHSKEMQVLSEVKKCETLRRKIVTFKTKLY